MLRITLDFDNDRVRINDDASLNMSDAMEIPDIVEAIVQAVIDMNNPEEFEITLDRQSDGKITNILEN